MDPRVSWYYDHFKDVFVARCAISNKNDAKPRNALNIPGHHSKLPATLCMTIISYQISAFVFDIILLVLTEIALCSNFLPVSPWVQRTKASRHPKKYASGNAVKTLISFSHLTFE